MWSAASSTQYTQTNCQPTAAFWPGIQWLKCIFHAHRIMDTFCQWKVGCSKEWSKHLDVLRKFYCIITRTVYSDQWWNDMVLICRGLSAETAFHKTAPRQNRPRKVKDNSQRDYLAYTTITIRTVNTIWTSPALNYDTLGSIWSGVTQVCQ